MKKFDIGDIVQCRFGNPGNKWWSELRNPVTIVDMRYDKVAGFFQLRFEEIPQRWFWENDFYLIKAMTANENPIKGK